MRTVTLIPFLTLFACGPSPLGDDSGLGGTVDASDPTTNPSIDSGGSGLPDANRNSIYPDAETFEDAESDCGDKWMCDEPVGDGCNPGTSDVCGNGSDDNCNGQVDEGCSCTAGAVHSCFLGPPGRRNVGACVDGMQTCTGSGEFTTWGPCQGGITPGAEVCDNLDNSCNGCIDDHPDCCDVELMCPGSMPDGTPFTPYVIDGTMFYGGTVTSWTWTVVGGPCDQLLSATAGTVSYTLSGANTSTLTFTPTLSGDYRVTVVMVTPSGTFECTFIIHIGGPGLRVELCWDTTGSSLTGGTDQDLHVHNADSTTPWFTTGLGGNNNNPDDCFYANCKATVFGTPVNWGAAYAPSPLSECVNGPSGLEWTLAGSCRNPRLDIDNISTVGIPENINVDVPLDGKTYRTMVHFYGGSSPTHPLVNVYCGGVLSGTYGAAPDTITGFNTGGGFGAGPMWRVVDATMHVAGTVTTGCTLTPLHPPGTTSGHWITTNDRSY